VAPATAGAATRRWPGLRLAVAVAVAAAPLVLVAVSASPAQAQVSLPACTDSWNNPISDNWETASDWSTGSVPGPGDVACIEVAGTYSVTLGGSATVAGLIIGGAGTGTQTLATGTGGSLTVAGTGAVLNGGAVQNGGAVVVGYDATFDLDGGTTTGDPVSLQGSSLDIDGTAPAAWKVADGYDVQVTGNVAANQSIAIGSGSALTFTGTTTSAGTITYAGSSSSDLEVASGTLTNTGVIEVEPGTIGTLVLGGTFDNEGTGVNGIIDDGSLSDDASLTNDGNLSIGSGATFTDGDVLDNATGTISNAGTLSAGYDRTFDEGSGAVSGNPVELTGSYLGLDGSGAVSVVEEPGYALDVNGTGTLAALQSLTLDAGSAVYGLSTNDGSLDSQPGSGGVVFGNALVNDGAFEVGSGSTTQIDGGYTQGSGGSVQFDIGDPTAYGNLHVSGPVSLAGGLITQTSGFTPTIGQSFEVLDANANPVSGTFSSTAFGAQPYTVVYGSGQVDLVAASGMEVTTSGVPAGTVGSPYSAPALTTSGAVGAVSWSLHAPTLPPGLVLDPTSGVISGTPTEAGTYHFVVTALDSSTPVPQQASASFDLTIGGGGLTVTTTALPSTVVGESYPSTHLTSSGGDAPITWAVAKGKLPAGLSLDPATGAITGTATKAGVSTLTVTATDSSSPNAERAATQLTLTVASALSVSTTSLPAGQIGAPYSSSLASTGGTAPVTWSVTNGTLPAGLSLSTATGAITGTPTGPGATSAFTVTATDSSTPVPLDASVSLAITVNGLPLNIVSPPPTQSGGALAGGQVGMPYAGTTFASTGGTAPVTWSVTSGSLPAGLTLAPATGVLGGTPTSAGKSAFTVTATDATTPTPQTAKIKLTITVVAPLVVTTTSLPAAQIGVAYSAPVLAATGGTAPVSWSVTGGKLPAGLSLAASGSITGTPSALGTSSFHGDGHRFHQSDGVDGQGQAQHRRERTGAGHHHDVAARRGVRCSLCRHPGLDRGNGSGDVVGDGGPAAVRPEPQRHYRRHRRHTAGGRDLVDLHGDGHRLHRSDPGGGVRQLHRRRERAAPGRDHVLAGQCRPGHRLCRKFAVVDRWGVACHLGRDQGQAPERTDPVVGG
jgi:hypothetical protein